MSLVAFLHPPLDGAPSGGNRYNRRMIGMAQRRGFPLESITVFPDDESLLADAIQTGRPWSTPGGSRGKIELWDGLLMPRLVESSPERDARHRALLIHYLPSLDPLLEPTSRAAARQLEDRASALVRYFLVTGKRVADVLRQRYPGREILVCEPGVDSVFALVRRVSASSKKGEAPVALLTVANLLPAKGYTRLMEILRRLPVPGWCWHIVGSATMDPVFAAAFKAGVRELIADGRIVMHEALESADLAALMMEMDVFVSASHYESYGMALVEAVTAGLPVLATAVGEADRFVKQGQNGFLVPLGEWDDFSDKLARLILSKALRRTLRETDPPRVRSWGDAFSQFSAACELMGEQAD